MSRAVRSKAEACDGFEAGFRCFAVQRQGIGDIRRFAVSDLIEFKIFTGQFFIQADGYVKAFVFFFIHVLQADVDDLVTGLFRGYFMHFLNSADHCFALLLRQGFRNDVRFFRQVQVIHGTDDCILVSCADFCCAFGGCSDVVFCTVRHADGHGVRFLAFLHGAQGPVAIIFGQGNGFLVGDADGINIRHERFHILVRSDRQLGDYVRKGNILRAGERAGQFRILFCRQVVCAVICRLNVCVVVCRQIVRAVIRRLLCVAFRLFR